jgi:hypothetical protein
MNNLIIPEIDEKALEGQVNPLVVRARSLEVKTQTDDEEAQKGLVSCATAEKFIRAVYKDPKAVLDKAHDDMCAAEHRWLDPIVEAKRLYSDKHNRYAREQQAIADKRAAELAAMAQKQEEDRRLADAAAAEAEGDHEGAEAIISEPIAPVRVAVPVAITKVAGVYRPRAVWSAEITDMKALIKWVASRIDQDPGVAAYLEPCTTALNAIARAQKSALRIGGVRAVEKDATNVRTAV